MIVAWSLRPLDDEIYAIHLSDNYYAMTDAKLVLQRIIYKMYLSRNMFQISPARAGILPTMNLISSIIIFNEILEIMQKKWLNPSSDTSRFQWSNIIFYIKKNQHRIR